MSLKYQLSDTKLPGERTIAPPHGGVSAAEDEGQAGKVMASWNADHDTLQIHQLTCHLQHQDFTLKSLHMGICLGQAPLKHSSTLLDVVIFAGLVKLVCTR